MKIKIDKTFVLQMIPPRKCLPQNGRKYVQTEYPIKDFYPEYIRTFTAQ